MDNKDQKKNWFERIFSLDEFKFSALVCTQFVFLGLDICSFIKTGDIANNLLACNAYAIGAISGVNLIGMAINSYSNRNMNQYGTNQYSQYGTNSMYSSNGMGMNGYQNGTMNNLINQSPISTNGISTNPINQITMNDQMENESDPSARGI